MNKKNLWMFAGIFILVLFSATLIYPNYYNKGADFLNAKLGLGFKIPHFWDLPFRLGLDLQGGTHLVYEADLSAIKKEDYKSAMDGLRDIIERRVNVFGIQEPLVQTDQSGDNYRIIIELAGVNDPAQAIKIIGETPFLEFKQQRPEEQKTLILNKIKEAEGKTFEEIQKLPDWQLALEDPYFESTDLTGKYLQKATLNFDPSTNKPLISLQFNDEGSKLFETLTSNNVGKQLAIYIDNTLLSAPVVQEKISGGKAQISGDFTVVWAKDLVKNLNAGALPVPVKLMSQQNIGPTLGAASLRQSLTAGLYGFLAIVLFMIIFYRLPGIVASVALVIYGLLMLALFKTIPVTLTLAGIGGFILSMGMAVDANVLIFSRLREELKSGKDFGAALIEGFKRAWPSIRDGNLTTIMVALMFFGFGTSFIKGFAFTLILGILLSMFSAIFITKCFMRLFVGSKISRIKWLW
jgi:preprotein translocase subunit SecD